MSDKINNSKENDITNIKKVVPSENLKLQSDNKVEIE